MSKILLVLSSSFCAVLVGWQSLAFDSIGLDLDTLAETETHLPVVHIKSAYNYPDFNTDERFPSTVTIYGADGALVSRKFFDGEKEEYFARIRIRGATSAKYEKRQFSVKLSNASYDDNVEKEILNLGKSDRWVLNASAVDKSLMRNVIGYDFGKQIGLPSPNWRYVEVILNNDYLGVYLLSEQPDQNLSDLKEYPKKKKGGFIVRVNDGMLRKYKDREITPDLFLLPETQWYVEQKYPDPEKEENFQYRDQIVDTMQAADRAVWSNAIDSDTGLPVYTNHIDVESFAKYILMRDFFKDLDGFRRSVYLVKNNDGKVAIGPVWDFDASIGGIIVAFIYQYPETRDWTVGVSIPFGLRTLFPWFTRLMEDPYFASVVKAEWLKWKQDFLMLETHPAYEENRCNIKHVAPVMSAWVQQKYIQLVHGCQDLDMKISRVSGNCPVKRNFTRWDDELGDNTKRDDSWLDNVVWTDAPMYFPRNSRRYDTLTNECPQVQKSIWPKDYQSYPVSLIWWMSDRIDWIDDHLDDLDGGLD